MKTLLLRQRRHTSELCNLALVMLALPAAFWLRFDFHLERQYSEMLPRALALALAAKFVIFRCYSLRDLAWRYLGFDDLVRLGVANATAALALSALLRTVIGSAFPRSIYLLDLLVSLALLTSVRAFARYWFDHRKRVRRRQKDLRPQRSAPRRVLIYGAGQAGRRILEETCANASLGFDVAGFIDDDPGKRHLRIGSVRVLGVGKELEEISRQGSVAEIWLAMPTASGAQITTILDRCRLAQVAAKRIPPLGEILEGRVLVDQLREVEIEDLLERAPVSLKDQGSLNTLITGKVVLVTGAGGSIGSELCRQIARARPFALVALDQAETALYQIDQEMREQFPELSFYPEIANIQHQRRLDEIFLQHRPAVVYHAAAYKHVPLMESHIFEAIENNVFGTGKLARTAQTHGVRTFVLISSDKAVRPANVMGATKRLAELACLARDETSEPLEKLIFNGKKQARKQNGIAPHASAAPRLAAIATAAPAHAPEGTRFLAVRFGNVLGSNGSVIPLFRRQIAAGGPITVTHPEMRRYFMTIPEAAQLVLQAGVLGLGGEIFVLDMGEPVKIVDLARKMVWLSGLRPGRDIQIEYSGVRPGEKLFEELNSEEEHTYPTSHPKIRVCRPRSHGGEEPGEYPHVLASQWQALRWSAARRDLGSTVLQLKEMVPGFSPSTVLLRQALAASNPAAARGKAAGA